MSAAVRESKRAWFAAGLAGIAGVALIAALFRGPPEPSAAPPQARPILELPASGHALVSDRALFKDPTPLFLPTRWNATPPDQGQPQLEGTFQGYGPDYSFSENELQLNLPPPVTVPAGPAHALVENAPGNPFIGIGRTDAAVAPLPPRWALVEVLAAGDGRVVYTQPLKDLAMLSEPLLRGGGWRPVEFMAAVDPAGLVGRLAPVVRLEPPGEDRFVQLPGKSVVAIGTYLADTLRLGDRLPPGLYSVTVGP
jgi:hypothetical protein